MGKKEINVTGYYSCKFVVDESPYCVWHDHLEIYNKSVIRGINHEYFEYLLEIYTPGLEKDETKQQAAIALRSAYYQGLEYFFALLFASLQAPKCVFAWLNQYQTKDVRNLVAKIDFGEDIKSRFQLVDPSWVSISTLIHSTLKTRIEESTAIAEIFSKFWAHYAYEFLKEPNIAEYNSIKHGFRLNLGGFGSTFGGKLLGESEFGSSSLKVMKIEDLKHHLTAEFRAINWEPEYIRAALHGIAFSINNIRTFLKQINGIATGEDKYRVYTDVTMFEAMLKEYTRPTLSDISMDSGIGKENITLFSKKDILDSYDRQYRKAIIVTAWNNGQHLASGGGYGFKFSIRDRDRLFRREWKHVFFQLQGQTNLVETNIDKDSFWGPNCRELISKEIGSWLRINKWAPWPKGRPPKFVLEPMSRGWFKVVPCRITSTHP